jgi:RNA polymerase sigma factor for flagellar operon FliA
MNAARFEPTAARLSLADEAELWARSVGGQDPIARERLILRYMPLVHSTVRRLGLRGDEYDDMVGQGVLGLICAVDRYDPARGASFSTFASRHVEGRVRDSLRALDPLSQTARRRLRRVELAEDHLAQQLGRAPAEAELAVCAGLALRSLRAARCDADQARAWQACQSAEDNEEVFDGPSEEAADPLAALIEGDLRAQVRRAVGALPERERAIVNMHYGQSLTLREIAVRLGLSEARVCQLHGRAVAALRDALHAGEPRLPH